MDKWLNQIDRTTEKFIDTSSDLNAEQLNWKPNAETWSIAQNIDHIIKLNNSYCTVFENLKQGKNKLPFISRFGFVVRFFLLIQLNHMQTPAEKRKVKLSNFGSRVKTISHKISWMIFKNIKPN